MSIITGVLAQRGELHRYLSAAHSHPYPQDYAHSNPIVKCNPSQLQRLKQFRRHRAIRLRIRSRSRGGELSGCVVRDAFGGFIVNIGEGHFHSLAVLSGSCREKGERIDRNCNLLLQLSTPIYREMGSSTGLEIQDSEYVP